MSACLINFILFLIFFNWDNHFESLYVIKLFGEEFFIRFYYVLHFSLIEFSMTRTGISFVFNMNARCT
jgi:hypothetical protein